MVFNTIRLSEPLDLTEVIFTFDTVSPLSHHLFKCAARPSHATKRGPTPPLLSI